jgi:hypothetical protein
MAANPAVGPVGRGAARGLDGEPTPFVRRLNHVCADASFFWFVDGVYMVQAFVPPSTVRLAPVMYEDSGPATKATNAATSSTLP